MNEKKKVILYTDGACSGNPGLGGYAGILIYGEHRLEYNAAEKQTTNNRMEVLAVIAGLKRLKYPCIVDVYSDSAYTVNAFLNGWIYGWKKNGWKKTLISSRAVLVCNSISDDFRFSTVETVCPCRIIPMTDSTRISGILIPRIILYLMLKPDFFLLCFAIPIPLS